jgi:hypothetical protein
MNTKDSWTEMVTLPGMSPEPLHVYQERMANRMCIVEAGSVTDPGWYWHQEDKDEDWEPAYVYTSEEMGDGILRMAMAFDGPDSQRHTPVSLVEGLCLKMKQPIF